MNFDQAKALRLQQWRSILDDHDFRLQNPEAHRQTLHSMSATLLSEGLIDVLQQFDMNEMGNAAYWHAVEELHSAPARYCSASSYEVVCGTHATPLGRISRSIFYAERALASAARFAYDGKVYQEVAGTHLVFNPSGTVATITGLTLTLPDGQQYNLVETGRMIDGRAVEPIDDPDIYRALVDVAQVAEERRDVTVFEKLRPLIDLARFRLCPACHDRFAPREDCPTCAGRGFVTKALAMGLP
ncbi:hypothetical protein PMI35_01274 [Pseudomonas sp. GM78]|uniref:hypothetical protein n=1 Tax=Pseudomonas sp. GM78 TaxID=1144337 RepID=UPI00026F85F9|nr:hypothetical protein [Pseudomonas sp. GM78]EJN31785.1 hypothetical protein PMI35_01274 [Pseudomonas sp. GM78]